MTQDEIIKIAKNSGYWSGQTIEMNGEGLMHFAEKIADIVRSESESAARSAYQCETLSLEEHIDVAIKEVGLYGRKEFKIVPLPKINIHTIDS